MNNKLFLWVFLVIIMAVPASAFGIPSHKLITQKAIKQYISTVSPVELSDSAFQNEVIKGVEEEDYAYGAQILLVGGCNHFWNQKNNQGLVYFSPYKRYSLTCASAATRADEVYNNAIASYLAGDKKRGYKLLGQTLHLVQDMGSPLHTGNSFTFLRDNPDAHEYKDPYETYVDQHFNYNIYSTGYVSSVRGAMSSLNSKTAGYSFDKIKGKDNEYISSAASQLVPYSMGYSVEVIRLFDNEIRQKQNSGGVSGQAGSSSGSTYKKCYRTYFLNTYDSKGRLKSSKPCLYGCDQVKLECKVKPWTIRRVVGNVILKIKDTIS